MKNTLLFAICTFCALLSACRKDRPDQEPEPPLIAYWDTLPAITQTGANTFGCLVNGEVWVPRKEILVPWGILSAKLWESDGLGGCSINCKLITETRDDYINLGFGPTHYEPVVCYGNEVSLPNSNFSMVINHIQYVNSPIDSLENWINVSMVDTERNIVSGTFQFNLYSIQNPDQVLKITDGRFDLKYYPQ